jgi:hypothetical protein
MHALRMQANGVADILLAAGEGTFCHPSFEKWHPKKTPASLRDDGV